MAPTASGQWPVAGGPCRAHLDGKRVRRLRVDVGAAVQGEQEDARHNGLASISGRAGLTTRPVHGPGVPPPAGPAPHARTRARWPDAPQRRPRSLVHRRAERQVPRDCPCGPRHAAADVPQLCHQAWQVRLGRAPRGEGGGVVWMIGV
jgi:hypothetical protein